MMKPEERRDIMPLLLKFGVAIVFSSAGIFAARLRRKESKPSLPPPPPPLFSGGRAHCKDDIHPLKTVPSSCSLVSLASQTYEDSHQPDFVDNSVVGSAENSGYLLPEFNSLEKEGSCCGTNTGYSPWADIETPKFDVKPSRTCRGLEKDDIEQEVKNLRNMVRMHQDREKNLEVQLLEYYGLREQETAVMELQNRLKLNNMEGKLLNLKIESLQEDNRRLQALAADHAKTVSELEVAKTKIKLLKNKLTTEAQRNREQILAIQNRVAKMQEQAQKGATIDLDTQSRLQRLKNLEVEAEYLRKSNMKLQQENSELAQKLKSAQMRTISIMEDPETEALKETSLRLREENERLSKEVEKLHADKCAGVEELVYLKWINACLRYELRNYMLPAGKTVARDLSKTLSPESEKKAKQLILEYAHTEGHGNIMDIDSDSWSSSQASCITESRNHHDDSSADKSFSTNTSTPNRKLFHKLRKLLRGKDVSPVKCRLSDDTTGSFEVGDSPWRGSCTSSLTATNAFSPQSSSRHSVDIQRSRSVNEDNVKNVNRRRSNSDMGFYAYKRFSLSRENASDFEKQHDQVANLLKLADVLKRGHE